MAARPPRALAGGDGGLPGDAGRRRPRDDRENIEDRAEDRGDGDEGEDRREGSGGRGGGASLVGALAAQASNFAQGIVDAFAFPASFVTIYTSRAMMDRTLRNVRFNGILFLGSILVYHYGLLALLDEVQTALWNAVGALRPADSPPPPLSLEETKALIAPALTTVYYTLWVYPCYCISFLWSAPLCQEIADEMFRRQDAVRPVPAAPMDAVASMANTLFRTVLVPIFLLESILVVFIPLLGPPISFVLFCWIYAYYSFEYNWIHRGWDTKRRARFFENRWAYFAGFGFPYTLTTVLFPQMISGGLFALVFPMYIVMANLAKPLPLRNDLRTQPEHWLVPKRLPIFDLSTRATTALVGLLLPRWLRQ